MRFGAVPVSEAEGAVLAHSLGLEGGRLRKGLVLEAAHVARLERAGVREVTVARLDANDMAEDEAAQAVADSLAGPGSGLRLAGGSTGRVNLYADHPGVLEIDAEAVNRANLVDPMITLATLAPYAWADLGQMVGTVKIISYAVDRPTAKKAARLLSGAMRVLSVKLAQADLVQTRVEGQGERVIEKGARVVGDRCRRLGISLERVSTVGHSADELCGAIRECESPMLMILSGSATSDAMDVAPESVRRAGGTVDRFGMPVDPGNLLFLGSLGNRRVIGLPGCARSPAPNGADWVIQRVACGVEVSGADIARMGVGGLLKEGKGRPHPRERA